eukprot:m.154949 g.154949  ORF g.154949 m.154949 type:complete len:336 (-) comp16402_c0_seq1:404-1411(-)
MPPFLFESQEHLFPELRYLGSVPLSSIAQDDRNEAIQTAATMLFLKLQKIFDRLVTETMERKGGNPENAKQRSSTGKFLTKHGHDCRRGDPVEIKLTTSEVVVLPTHSYGTKPITFRSSHTTACVMCPKHSSKKLAIVGFTYEGRRKAAAHLVSIHPAAAQDFCDTVLESTREARRLLQIEDDLRQAGYSQASEELQRRRTNTADGDNLTITMAIGLKRRSSIKVNAGLRRKNSTLGGDRAVPSGSVASMSSAVSEVSDNSEEAFGFGSAVGQDAAAGGMDDDDLLADVDEALFSHVDVLDEQDAEDLNLDGFGFVEEETGPGDEDEDEMGGFGF